jgi:hypothetical protein
MDSTFCITGRNGDIRFYNAPESIRFPKKAVPAEMERKKIKGEQP